MIKLSLLKKPKQRATRDELIEYLETVHGPHNSQLTSVDYTPSKQIKTEDESEIPEDMDYYDSSDTIPVDPADTRYDTLGIHKFDSIEELIEAQSTEHSEEAEKGLHDVMDFEMKLHSSLRMSN